MLGLSDSRRHDAPAVQPLRSTIAQAPTLAQLSLAVGPLACVRALHLIAYGLAARAQRPGAWPPCPCCGRSLRRKGVAPRPLPSLFGPLRWRRRVGRCPHGGDIPQVAPCDETLGGQPPQRTSGALQCLGWARAGFVPFATAARWLGGSGGDVVSPRAVWCWGPAAGCQAMEPLQEALGAVARGYEPTPEPLTAAQVALPLALGAEGVMMPCRSEGGQAQGKLRWRELKVGVLARLGQHRTRTGQVVTRRVQRRLVAGLGDMDALTPRLWLAALRQGIRSAPQVVWRRDGGRGVGRLDAECFAGHARGILDLYHAAQQLGRGAAAWLDGRTPQARRWFGWARHRLRHGMPDGGRADLTEARDVEGLPETAREPWRIVYTYLSRHREHINYDMDTDVGLPLGSGMVESACKWLIQQRFKGGGRRGSEAGFNHLVHLRLAGGNRRFETLFGLALSPNS